MPRFPSYTKYIDNKYILYSENILSTHEHSVFIDTRIIPVLRYFCLNYKACKMCGCAKTNMICRDSQNAL